VEKFKDIIEIVEYIKDCIVYDPGDKIDFRGGYSLEEYLEEIKELEEND
jgi:hypothetical protein